MPLPRPRSLLIALLACCAPRLLPAAENPLQYWDEVAIDATRLARNPPPLAALLYATYHLAIFDAVNGIDHKYKGWLVNDPAPPGVNPDAVVASASITVLNALWVGTNSRTSELAYEKVIDALPDDEARANGIAWGKKVAEAILANRADCGYNKPVPGVYSSTEIGKWRETPSAFRPALLPFWGQVRPFAMTSPSQFRAPPPLPITSKEYADELAYVNRVGPRDGADRTEYQTLCTPFWSDDLGTSTPPGHWNLIAQDLARRRNLSLIEAARLFALLDMAEADAGIQCWESKYFYRTWRPETALREMDAKVNPSAAPNPDFIPNMPSPPFPAYPSGHSTFSGAGARLMALFFGTDEIEFSLRSDGLPGVIHNFTRLSDAQREAGMSRVWGGIHTMTDNLVAQKAGMTVAEWVYKTQLQPVAP